MLSTLSLIGQGQSINCCLRKVDFARHSITFLYLGARWEQGTGEFKSIYLCPHQCQYITNLISRKCLLRIVNQWVLADLLICNQKVPSSILGAGTIK